MKFSIWPSSERSTGEIVDVARWADEHGWYGVWFADHYMPNTDDGAPADGAMHEAWSVLPAIAVVTKRVRLGPLVSPTTVHHPALLANRAATIDHLSNGRFVLGMGAGWQVNEHRAYGIELPDPAVRVDRFEEAIQVVRSLLDRSRTTFGGRHFDIADAPCDPPPVQDHLPILVGTSGPRMQRIAARHADEWNTWGPPELVRARGDSFRTACDAVGRDPASVHRSAQALIMHADRIEDNDRLSAMVPADRSVIGTTDQLCDAVAAYADLGFDEFIVPDFTFGSTPTQRRDRLERFHAEVVRAVAG